MEKLHWWGRGIGDVGCEELHLALVNRSTGVINLLLGGNELGDACMHSLVALADKGGLRSLMALGLSKNYITEHGCESLAGAMLRGLTPRLSELYISNNRGLGDRCALALAKAMTAGSISSLRKVSWGDSTMTDVGFGAILAALRVRGSSSLHQITLTNSSLLCTKARRTATFAASGATVSSEPAAKGSRRRLIAGRHMREGQRGMRRMLREGRKLGSKGKVGLTITFGKSRCTYEDAGEVKTVLLNLSTTEAEGSENRFVGLSF